MATTEPVQSPVENEEKPETKASPVKDNIKENGQEPAATETTKTPEEQADPKTESGDAEVKETSESPQEEETKEEVEGQDEADRPAKEEQRKEEEDDEEGAEEEESSDDEPQVGSLDGPVKLMTGKRERKKVERLTMQSPTEKEKEKLQIKEGRGIKLGDCPIIEFNLQRRTTDALKPLSRILFYKIGKANEIKRNIRKFSGFPFTKDDKTEMQRKEKQLERFTTSGLRELCTVLALERKGHKEDLMNRLMDYCLEPTMITKKPPMKRKKGSKKKKSGKKRKRSAKGDASDTKKEPKSSEQAEEDDDDDDNDNDDDGDEDGDDEVEEKGEEEEEEEAEEESPEEEDSEYEEPKKKKARKSTPKSAKKTKAKTPAKTKAKTPKKSPTKKSAAKKKAPASDVDSSDDEEPLAKKSDSPPSENEIRSVIQKFLEGANLEQVTMKTVCRMVYDKYPDFDLTPKKDFIKSTVKEIISS